jgi:maleylacetoacetate isomerase
MENLNLYNYFRSSTSYRVRIALELKKLPYTNHPVHLLNNGGEQHSDEYRRINPMGGVPSLVHGEKVISQSFAIIDYLDAVFKAPFPLFSEDKFITAKIRQFCEVINADIHPLQNLKVMQFLEKQYHLTSEQKHVWLNKWINEGLQSLETMIAPFAGQFCFGDQITAADLFLIPQLFSSQRFNIDITQYKTLEQINKNCMEVEAFKKAHPYRQPDTPDEFKI